MDRPQILEIAERCRLWAERTAVRAVSIGLGDDIDQRDLMGMCIIAARKLFRELKLCGFDPQLAVSYAHAFVLVPCDGRMHVLDITATQFDRERVVLIPLTRARASYWKLEKVFGSERSLIRSLRADQWNECEIVVPRKSTKAPVYSFGDS